MYLTMVNSVLAWGKVGNDAPAYSIYDAYYVYTIHLSLVSQPCMFQIPYFTTDLTPELK